MFFGVMMLTTFLPYVPYVLTVIPGQIFGFNLTGWAWLMMLIITLFNILFTRRFTFPILFWMPWLIYIIGYLIYDFSSLGFQLTLQYALPLLAGIVASGFTYSEEELEWLFKWFVRICTLVIMMFIFGYLFRGGYTPASGATPMLLTIVFSLFCGLFFLTRDFRYIIPVSIIFIIPAVDVSRMGIAAMAAIFVFHFANKNPVSKIVFSILGVLIFVLVFNSKGFQEKTFISGRGTLKELTFNYYDNPNIRITGRISWKKALESGLEKAPIWGNGPRSDYRKLVEVTGLRTGEAHNDYMSVRHNYGYVGLGLLLTGFLLTFISLYRISLTAGDENYLWLIVVTVLTLFISFLMFMYTDNILKYTIYFPNYFFALIGIIYSIKKNENIGSYSAV
jgi:hypothetical protein